VDPRVQLETWGLKAHREFKGILVHKVPKAPQVRLAVRKARREFKVLRVRLAVRKARKELLARRVRRVQVVHLALAALKVQRGHLGLVALKD
jgi:hypothetical protein